MELVVVQVITWTTAHGFGRRSYSWKVPGLDSMYVFKQRRADITLKQTPSITRGFFPHSRNSMPKSVHHQFHRIGWWENWQESPIFHGKTMVSCKFSLKPIQWQLGSHRDLIQLVPHLWPSSHRPDRRLVTFDAQRQDCQGLTLAATILADEKSPANIGGQDFGVTCSTSGKRLHSYGKSLFCSWVNPL